jgi:hypothetical protein
MIKAFTIPSKIPMIAAIKNTKKMFKLSPIRRSKTAIVYPDTVAIAVNEISIPPEISTKSIPMAKVPINEALFNKSKKFSSVKKAGLMSDTTATNMTITANTYVSCRNNNFFISFLI